VTEGAARVARGTAAGFLGGIIASWVMNRYQAADHVRKHEQLEPVARFPSGRAQNMPSRTGMNRRSKWRRRYPGSYSSIELSPTEKRLPGRRFITDMERRLGLYGGLSELIPSRGEPHGIPYATVVVAGWG